jgi:hypothetical protein
MAFSVIVASHYAVAALGRAVNLLGDCAGEHLGALRAFPFTARFLSGLSTALAQPIILKLVGMGYAAELLRAMVRLA